MKQLFRGNGGYACDLAVADGCWSLVYLAVADVDERFVADFGIWGERHQAIYMAQLKAGVSPADWSQSLTATPRELHLVWPSHNGMAQTCLAQAERLDGPAVLGGVNPAVVWTQRGGKNWSLRAHASGETRIVCESPQPLRNPSACRDSDGRLWCACDYREAGQDMVCVQMLGKTSGDLEIPGRRPRLVGGRDGSVWLTYERAEGGCSHIYLQHLHEDAKTTAVKLSDGDELNFTAHPLIDEEEQVLVVWENAPGWGEDEQFGRFRRLMLKAFDPRHQKVWDGPGTEKGVIPMPIAAVRDSPTNPLSLLNLIPLNPLLLLSPQGLMCTYRRFRFAEHYSFGWHVFETHLPGHNWSAPRQLTQPFGFADTPYRVLAKGDELLVAAHCCEHQPWTNEQRQGNASRNSLRAFGHGVELWQVATDERIEEKSLADQQLKVISPPAVSAPAPTPEALQHPPAVLQLIWGDLHAHSCLSKCMSANDGMPADVLRWQRDVVGCQVLCLTEHVEYVSSLEFLRFLDLVEGEAADHDIVPLYGVEWAKYPAHHTNFFCIDRQIFDQLRAVLLQLDHLSPTFEHIKAEFPPHSVLAIRHYHGQSEGAHHVLAEDVTATYDPQLEWAMEAAQIRGDMMFAPPKHYPPFPANFLQAGARIGLVAGSDHARGGRLKFCFTGFWVPQVTPQAVFDALRERRTTGSVSGKMAVWLRTADVDMGQEGQAGLPVELVAELAAARPLLNVRLWRDGQWISETSLSATTASVVMQDTEVSPGEHCYLVRAEAKPTVADLPVVGYSSPIWLQVQ